VVSAWEKTTWKLNHFHPQAGTLDPAYPGTPGHGKPFIIQILIDVTYNHNGLLSQLDALVAETPRMRLSEIARTLRVDRHTIENAMCSRRKITFREYRRRYLLQAARKMLDQPHLSVKEIGIMLGYSSAASFSRFAQQATGKSPSRLRNGEEQE
jgi:methylphosphotriester-DNA--protein-cysteine methyltransferase